MIPKLNRTLTKSLVQQQVDQTVLKDRLSKLESLLYFVCEHVLIGGLEESHTHISAFMKEMEEQWQLAASLDASTKDDVDKLSDGSELPDT